MDMNKLRLLPVTGVLLATILTVAACGAAAASHPAAAPSTQQADTASASTTPTDIASTAPAGSASAPSPTAPAGQAAFASALAQWKSAAAANAATMNMYLLQAADDLRGSGYPGSGAAADELAYLANLPPTNDTPTQQANAHSDVKALDSFFGTPGLMS